jgi:hypothetical protein
MRYTIPVGSHTLVCGYPQQEMQIKGGKAARITKKNLVHTGFLFTKHQLKHIEL